MNELKKLLKELKDKGFATPEEKEKLNTLLKELSEEEQSTVQPEVTEAEALPEEKPAEEPKEDEKTVEQAAEEAADKVLAVIREKMQKKQDAEIEAKKKAMLETEVKIVSPKHKIYTSRKGVEVFATLDEAKAINKWFKALVMFKKTKQPNYFKDVQDAAHFLDKMAISQKLEPINETTGADGQFLVPTIMYNKIVPFLEDEAQIKPASYQIDMTGIKSLDIPNIAAGAYVQWNSESAQKATTSMVFGHQTLTPYTLAGILVITQQMLDDAPFPMLQIISQELARAIAKAEDAAFASGSGSGQPTGIDTYTPVYTTSAGGVLTYDHLVSALLGLPNSYRSSRSLRWIMHRNAMRAVATLKDSNGRPIFDLSNPMSNILYSPNTPAALGIPIIENNDVTEKTIYLVDLSYYWIGVNRGLAIDVATEATIGGVMDAAKGGGTYLAGHNLWERNELAVRAEERIDGELVTTRALSTITAVVP